MLRVCKRLKCWENEVDGWTPLMRATYKIHKIIDFSNINQQNHDGKTALYLCCRWGTRDNVKLLLKNGANPRIKNPINIVYARRDRTLYSLMLRYGAHMVPTASYPNELKRTAFTWLLICKRLKKVPKDLQYLMINYFARDYI